MLAEKSHQTGSQNQTMLPVGKKGQTHMLWPSTGLKEDDADDGVQKDLMCWARSTHDLEPVIGSAAIKIEQRLVSLALYKWLEIKRLDGTLYIKSSLARQLADKAAEYENHYARR